MAWHLKLTAGDTITAINQQPLNPNEPCRDFTAQLHDSNFITTSTFVQFNAPTFRSMWTEGGASLITEPLQTQQINLQKKLDSKSINPLFQSMACLSSHSPYPVLPIVKAVQNKPLKLFSITESIRQQLIPPETAEQTNTLSEVLSNTQSLSYPRLSRSESIKAIPLNCSSDALFDQLERFLSKSHQLSRVAFDSISQQDTHFFLHHYQQLSNSLIQSKSIMDETDGLMGGKAAIISTALIAVVFIIHQLLEIASRVNMIQLSLAAEHWFQLADPDWLASLQNCLSTLKHTSPLQRNTAFGKIILGTIRDDIYHMQQEQENIALLIDPAGNDTYQKSIGKLSSISQHLYNTAIIDLSGDDQYHTSRASGFAFAALRNSLLLDLSGNDQYHAGHWAQGSAFAGIAALYDYQGNDQYNAAGFSQAAALFGTALLIDNKGNDQYSMQHHGQALGLPYGHAVLMDSQGDDQYIMDKGLASSYEKTPQSSESWGQGCGKGFRHILPGGLGILFDTQGSDSFSAGEFSQGGGYYYGMGLLYNLGNEDDSYQGSRYNSGFAAHQSIGGLIESGGNDHYKSSGPAFCGSAWDQSISLFSDQSGDDNYSGKDFSYAASAHNSITSFWDISGHDRFNGTINPAHITSNQYHGGHSLSYFFSANQTIRQRIEADKHEFVIISSDSDKE